MSTKLYSGRRRLVLATLLCMLCIFAGIGFGAHAVARRESDELFSARLATSARVLEGLVAHQVELATIDKPLEIALPHELETTTSNDPKVYGHRYETKIAFQVWRDDGTLLVKSASAPLVPLAPLRAGFSEHEIDGATWQVFVLNSGRVWVVTAENDDVRQELSEDIGASILSPLLIGGVLMLVVVNIVLVRSVHPLRLLADRIAAREPECLDVIELPETPLELAPIISELNSLLSRMRSAFEREQRFLNAAAHEIRTPIAAVQLHLENAIRAENQSQRQQSLEAAMTGARRTSKLAEQLLALGRISAAGDNFSMRPLQLADLCADVIGAVVPLLDTREQTIGLDAELDCPIYGEPSLIRRLLQNLIDNASMHGAIPGDIDVTLRAIGADIVLVVANDGEPIPEQELEHLFTPYYRVQGAKTGGHGLGLAIVREIVDMHHAQISVRPKDSGTGTLVQVIFPRLVQNQADPM